MCVALCLDISSLVSILCQAMTGTDDTDAKLAPKKSCNIYIYIYTFHFGRYESMRESGFS